MDKTYHSIHFNYHEDNAQRTTQKSLKGDPKVISSLKKSKTFLHAHFWKEDELSIKDIGFVVIYVPSKQSKAFIANDMLKRIKQLPDLEWAKVPQFHLIHATPKVKLSGYQKPLSTQA
jgi:G:T-mismatch repair DNA endonuclease (very short patch repair protein)